MKPERFMSLHQKCHAFLCQCQANIVSVIFYVLYVCMLITIYM